MDTPSKPKLIHVASIQPPKHPKTYLFLRQLEPYQYVWFQAELAGQETITSVWAGTIEEALRLARQTWKNVSFQFLHCGFRYTLPERDEHGTNALFSEMLLSYASSTGIYFDEELNANCHVQNASLEARALLKKLQ